jgi:hypothetical protein
MIEIFQQFIAAYPEWKLHQSGYDTYVLSWRMHTQDELSDFNPDTAVGAYGQKPNVTKVITKGAYAPFVLSAIGEVAFDGTILSFKFSGRHFSCNGAEGIIAVRI